MKNIVELLGAQEVLDNLNVLLNGNSSSSSNPYTGPVHKILVAEPGTAEQSLHLDYVFAENEEVPANQYPMSAMAAIHGDTTHIVLDIEYKKTVVGGVTTHFIHKLVVPLNPGDLVMWTGFVAHAGGAYARFNMRLFAYFPTQANQPDDSLTHLTYTNTRYEKYVVSRG